ncbi:MAG TPA: hypothetical protein P5084_10005 [Paludibacter sp.]|nr:hypothetical protein [Paludibacter sp.]
MPEIVQVSLPLPVQVSAVGVTVTVKGASAAKVRNGKAENSNKRIALVKFPRRFKREFVLIIQKKLIVVVSNLIIQIFVCNG